MSYEYFLQAHLNHGPQQISTTRILQIFSKYIVAKDKTYVDIAFDDGSTCSIFIDTELPYNDNIMISRPCEGKLGDCVYEIMNLGNFVFFEPDGKHMIIINPDVHKHLPPDMIDTLGEPVIAQTMEEFLELYNNNRT